jgi:hypothetical protein
MLVNADEKCFILHVPEFVVVIMEEGFPVTSVKQWIIDTELIRLPIGPYSLLSNVYRVMG